jgi:hypothetical protein
MGDMVIKMCKKCPSPKQPEPKMGDVIMVNMWMPQK